MKSLSNNHITHEITLHQSRSAFDPFKDIAVHEQKEHSNNIASNEVTNSDDEDDDGSHDVIADGDSHNVITHVNPHEIDTSLQSFNSLRKIANDYATSSDTETENENEDDSPFKIQMTSSCTNQNEEDKPNSSPNFQGPSPAVLKVANY